MGKFEPNQTYQDLENIENVITMDGIEGIIMTVKKVKEDLRDINQMRALINQYFLCAETGVAIGANTKRRSEKFIDRETWSRIAALRKKKEKSGKLIV